MSPRSAIVLASTQRLLRPLARLLLRHGVAYPAFAAAMKKVFLEAARDELRASAAKPTDSALSLLSGVHRRDVRMLSRHAAAQEEPGPMSMASQVVARWLGDPECLDALGRARPLSRADFDALVAGISRDVRPRAVLDELVRLGLAEAGEGEGGTGTQVRLLGEGLVPRQGFAEMARLLQDNLHDHLAAASANLDGGHNYLEQAVFVDQLSAESAQAVHAAAARAWRQAFHTVLHEAQARFDHDQIHADPAARVHRARFGGYFFSAEQDDQSS